MKAAVFLGPEKIEVRDVEKPNPKEGEVLLKVAVCAICGTDVRIYYKGQKNVVPPHIMGHEIAGTVEELGAGVTGIKSGERVVIVTSVGCGECQFCKKGLHNLCLSYRAIGYAFPGGFAEYMLIPKEAVAQGNLLPVPARLSSEEASLVEALSCCINGQKYLNISRGDVVVIFGAGPIGCMHIELARQKGASKIILINFQSQSRLDLAKRFKADLYLSSSKEDPVKRVLEETSGQGADVIITACSAKIAQEQAIRMANKNARISFFAGIPKDDPYIKLDSNEIHYKEICVFGAFASYRSQFEEAVELIASRRVDARKFLTHEFPLDDIVKGIETAKSGDALKVIIKP